MAKSKQNITVSKKIAVGLVVGMAVGLIAAWVTFMASNDVVYSAIAGAVMGWFAYSIISPAD